MVTAMPVTHRCCVVNVINKDLTPCPALRPHDRRACRRRPAPERDRPRLRTPALPDHPPPTPRRAARLADHRSRRVPPRRRDDARATLIRSRIACKPRRQCICGVPAAEAAWTGAGGLACQKIACPCGLQGTCLRFSGKFEPGSFPPRPLSASSPRHVAYPQERL